MWEWALHWGDVLSPLGVIFFRGPWFFRQVGDR